jgi:filamentous hemagglutinin
MREFEDLPDRDGADTNADARGEPATDVPPPRQQTAPDVAPRLAYTLEYRQRVDAEYAAHNATGPAQRNAESEQHPRVQAADRHERAEQTSREVELPASVRDLPEAREILPNLHSVEVDRRKFSEYSLNPDHPNNNGKAEGWRALGYDVDSPQARSDVAQDLHEVIRGELLACGKVVETRDTKYGPTYRVLSPFIGPNGRHATLVTCWIVESQPDNSHPKLTTAWVQPHRDKETPR